MACSSNRQSVTCSERVCRLRMRPKQTVLSRELMIIYGLIISQMVVYVKKIKNHLTNMSQNLNIVAKYSKMVYWGKITVE